MRRHSVLRDVRGAVLAAGLALTAGFLIGAAPASAAKPHAGGRYLGCEGTDAQVIEEQAMCVRSSADRQPGPGPRSRRPAPESHATTPAAETSPRASA